MDRIGARTFTLKSDQSVCDMGGWYVDNSIEEMADVITLQILKESYFEWRYNNIKDLNYLDYSADKTYFSDVDIAEKLSPCLVDNTRIDYEDTGIYQKSNFNYNRYKK